MLLQISATHGVDQIELLKSSLKGLNGTIFLGLTSRARGDALIWILLLGPVVFVVEFKTGDSDSVVGRWIKFGIMR